MAARTDSQKVHLTLQRATKKLNNSQRVKKCNTISCNFELAPCLASLLLGVVHTFATADKCALRHVLSGLVEHLGGVMVHNVPPAVEVDFLPALHRKDCFVHPNRHVTSVLCKAVGENDASTCTDGVEQCGRKEVAAYSGQRVLEGFHHSNARWLCHGRAARIDVAQVDVLGKRRAKCIRNVEVEVSSLWGEGEGARGRAAGHFTRPAAENAPASVKKLEVHRHQQKPALHIPLSSPAARNAPSPAELALYIPLSLSTTSAATSSSAMFARINKNVGCLRTLESGFFRNTQNSFGTSRSVLDKSWFGLRPFSCVKGSYLHERSRIV